VAERDTPACLSFSWLSQSQVRKMWPQTSELVVPNIPSDTNSSSIRPVTGSTRTCNRGFGALALLDLLMVRTDSELNLNRLSVASLGVSD
jgi:hypothetical protein